MTTPINVLIFRKRNKRSLKQNACKISENIFENNNGTEFKNFKYFRTT